MKKNLLNPEKEPEALSYKSVNRLARADFFSFLKKDFDKRGAGFSALLRSWENLIGDRAAYGRPEKIERKGAETVLIVVSDRRFATEAGYLKKEYLHKINLFLGGSPKIDDIVFINGLKSRPQQPVTETLVLPDAAYVHKRKKELLGLSFQNQNLEKTLEELAQEVICREYRDHYLKKTETTPVMKSRENADWRLQAKKLFQSGVL